MPTLTGIYYITDSDGNAGLVVLPVLEPWDMHVLGVFEPDLTVHRLLPENSYQGVYFSQDRETQDYLLLVRPCNSPEDIAEAELSLSEWHGDVPVKVLSTEQWLSDAAARERFHDRIRSVIGLSERSVNLSRHRFNDRLVAELPTAPGLTE